ncbi:VOC family protein [Amycolatopsis sp. NPDC049159]|uniref:VOC family protein n=1 Tax=Amycolatopsis sp. NPDC049159 TaxID=3157210 RepID=UPI0033F1A435
MTTRPWRTGGADRRPGRGRLLALGATLIRERGGDVDWDQLADPEGNEFCVFAPSV